MPTFSTPTHADTPSTAFSVPLGDSITVLHFREANASHVEKLNRDLGLSLDAYLFTHLQSFYRNSAKRDPTVGELRLLDGLDTCDRHSPRRLAVGELLTDSDAVAAAWADMMATHGALHRVGELRRGKTYPAAPPCPLWDALSLSGRYLYRTGLRTPPRGGSPEGSTVMLTTPAQEALAAAEGYTPVARITLGEESRSLWKRDCPPPLRIPLKTGDFLLYLPHLSPKAVSALLEANATADRPVFGELRPVAGEPLLSVLTDMCPGLDLYADRIASLLGMSEPGRIPVTLLCETPLPHPDGTADYILRVPLKGVHAATEIIRSLGLTATICGQARTGERTIIRIRNESGKEDTPVAELPTAFLRATAAVYLHRFEVQRQTLPPIPSRQPRWGRLPSPYAAENGMTADGQELTALLCHEGQVMAIPEADVLLSAMTLTLTEGGMGFASAADTAAEVTDRLLAVGVAPADMTLSVSVTVGDASLLTNGSSVEVLCGLYRVAMDREIPIDDPAWQVKDDGNGLRVTVVAWGYAPELRDEPALWDNRQWKASGEAIHKEAPAFLLPYVSPSDPPALSALSAALNRDGGAACSLHAVEVVTADEDGLPRRMIPDEAISSLVEKLTGWNTPILTLSEADTRLLLEQAPIREALESRVSMGYPIILLGEACRVFAAYGFLPEALTNTRAVTAETATVTYALPSDAAIRLPRAPLLIPQGGADLPHLLTLHLPNGVSVPDGFTGREGRVLGLLNGLDTTLLPLTVKNRFDP